MAARPDAQSARRCEGAGREEAEGGPAAAAAPRGDHAIRLIASQPAPAKVNLYLHVGAPGADGFHPLSSLVAFGAAADRVDLYEAEAFVFSVEGPFAGGLGGDDNLVVRAAHAIARAAGRPLPPVALVLHKSMPVAAGLGGGSSDAAAALRLLRDHAFPSVGDDVLLALLAELGSDGPMCLAAKPVVAEGRGDRLSPAPAFPDLPVVLVNPRVACPTGEIYRAYDEAGRFGGAARGDLKPAYAGVGAFAADLAACRNDLEPVARALRPEIGEALDWLSGQAGEPLVRMTGSGATCFGLFADPRRPAEIARRASAQRPDWWVAAGVLAGSCA